MSSRVNERQLWDRWLYGGLAVIVAWLLVSSLLLERDRGPRTTGPLVPELEDAVAMDRPLVRADVEGAGDALVRILALEDARAMDDRAVDELVNALAHDSPGVRRAAARALGRLERPELVRRMAPALEDVERRVRIEAANALAQAVFRGEGVEEARSRILGRLDREEDPAVQGALARALGRLPVVGGEGSDGEAALAADLEERARRLAALAHLPPDEPGGVGHDERLLGVARGAHFLFRRPQARVPAWDRGSEGRVALAGVLEAVAADPGAAGPVRRAAAQARIAAGAADPGLSWPSGWVEGLLEAPETELRRLGASVARDPHVLEGALSDPEIPVRVEAVRGWARHGAAAAGCAPLLAALDDPAHAVALAALQLLPPLVAEGGACAGEDAGPMVARLEALARSLPESPAGAWHRPVHALAALARIAPERVEAVDPELAFVTGHPDPFVRAHGARVAGVLGLEGRLRALVREDPSDNVREAALATLLPLVGGDPRAPGIQSLLVEQLRRDDPQIVRTAARLLAGAPATEETLAALFQALERFTAGRRATDRDPRVALLERIGALGDARDRGRLDPWIADPDPAVALAAARARESWTGESVPEALRGGIDGPRVAGAGDPPWPYFSGASWARGRSVSLASPETVPGWRALRALQDGRLVVELEGGGLEAAARVTIRMLPFEAPTSAYRVVELAREGALDGLTLHRVVANFVVQGGSPGANEYAGHGSYTRDEVGRVGHWTGTVGVSTRGRDTGDGQLFVNLVDNLRLDHDYTVFGVVEEGMEVLQDVQEGVILRRVRWEEAPGAPDATDGGEG